MLSNVFIIYVLTWRGSMQTWWATWRWNVYCSIESSSAMRQATWQCFRSLMALWRRYLGLSVCQVIIIIMFVCESVSVIVKYRLVFSCVLCVRWHNVFFFFFFGLFYNESYILMMLSLFHLIHG